MLLFNTMQLVKGILGKSFAVENMHDLKKLDSPELLALFGLLL